MTTCDESTRHELIVQLGDMSQRGWAKRHGIHWSVVSDCLLRNAMSPQRENALRSALGLEPLERTRITIRSNERVVKKPGYGKKRNYVEFKIRVSPAQADIIRQRLADLGYGSFSEWWNETGQTGELFNPFSLHDAA